MGDFPLNVPRAHSAVSPSPFQNTSQLFIMTGGYQNHVPLSSVENVTTQGWEILAPSLPVKSQPLFQQWLLGEFKMKFPLLELF